MIFRVLQRFTSRSARGLVTFSIYSTVLSTVQYLALYGTFYGSIFSTVEGLVRHVSSTVPYSLLYISYDTLPDSTELTCALDLIDWATGDVCKNLLGTKADHDCLRLSAVVVLWVSICGSAFASGKVILLVSWDYGYENIVLIYRACDCLPFFMNLARRAFFAQFMPTVETYKFLAGRSSPLERNTSQSYKS